MEKGRESEEACADCTGSYGKQGFPLFHWTYGGNISDKRIFKEMIVTLRERGYSSTVMDRGFYSKKNIENALALKMNVICGIIKDREMRKILLAMDRSSIYEKEIGASPRNTDAYNVYIKSIEFMQGKLMVLYNPQLEQIRRGHYYEHSSDEYVASLLGYSIICHNTSLDDKDVVKRYYAKDTIERAFKHMKGVLSLSPEGVWVLSYVYAHMKICYLSYAILSMLPYHIERAGISGEGALELLSGGYSMQLMDRGSGFNWSTNVELSMK